ncbi:hypothetical protein [Ectobacillus sp. sgz5001026]|uniref:hypothetical protein n=1 Tax=Ectobacillus sp. sgz5001026 TaxID=3242473 RepID=UPI0036D334E4
MIKHLYYYLVLFATLMMSIIGSVIVYRALVDYIAPSTYSLTEYTMTMEKQEPSDNTTVTVDKLIQSYEDTIVSEKQKIKNGVLNGIVKKLGFVIVPLPIFFYFQRQMRIKEKS